MNIEGIKAGISRANLSTSYSWRCEECGQFGGVQLAADSSEAQIYAACQEAHDENQIEPDSCKAEVIIQ